MSFVKYEPKGNIAYLVIDREKALNALNSQVLADLDAALDATEVPVSVYDSLIESVHANLDKMYRYVALRRRLLGADELHMYDVYTPIVPDVAEEIPFEQAKATVLDALAVLGEDYTAMLREGFDHRWLDVYPNVGKRGGAYSSGIARPHPYVLLNQTDDLDSQFTIAHEMGHAMHSYLSCKHQPVCTSDYVIFVAEVASTCNEILLMRHLLGKTDDHKQRAYLINHFLDQFKGTLYRQTMFAEFEKKAHDYDMKGKPLTPDTLNSIYYRLNKQYYGPGVKHDALIKYEWARIPHFYTAFYVYKYATGLISAVSIARGILQDKNNFAAYKKFLSAGGSDSPYEILKLAGVDLMTDAPYEAAAREFSETLAALESL